MESGIDSLCSAELPVRLPKIFSRCERPSALRHQTLLILQAGNRGCRSSFRLLGMHRKTVTNQANTREASSSQAHSLKGQKAVCVGHGRLLADFSRLPSSEMCSVPVGKSLTIGPQCQTTGRSRDSREESKSVFGLRLVSIRSAVLTNVGFIMGECPGIREQRDSPLNGQQ